MPVPVAIMQGSFLLLSKDTGLLFPEATLFPPSAQTDAVLLMATERYLCLLEFYKPVHLPIAFWSVI